MAAQAINETTTVFLLEGKAIQESIRTRVNRHQKEIDACLDKISAILEEKSPGAVSSQAAVLMLVLATGQYLTADALVVKAQLDRASFLSNENLDLTCIVRNLQPSLLYKVSLEEALRYGLV